MTDQPRNLFEWLCVKALLFIDYLDMGRRSATLGSTLTFYATWATLAFPVSYVITVRFESMQLSLIVVLLWFCLLNGLLTATMGWIKERQDYFRDRRKDN